MDKGNRGGFKRPIQRKPAGTPVKRTPTTIDARRLALNALSDVTRADAYATLALDKHLSRSHLSHDDKRLATGIFYTALENRIRLSHVLSQFISHMPEPIVEDILHIAAAQLLLMDRVPDHAAVDEAVKQVKTLGREGFAPLVNGTLRSLIRARDAGQIQYPSRDEFPIRYLSVMHSLPEPLVKWISDDYGLDEAEKIISYRPNEHEQVVRRNFMIGDAEGFERYLGKRGWHVRPSIVPGAYHVAGALDLGGDEDFKRGCYSLISESSMLAAYAMEPKRGQNLLDVCAAPGGKAAMLAELLSGTGRVHAWDVHEHRVDLLRAARERLRLDNLRPAVRDAKEHRADQELMFDAVLIDAPCSGLGVMLNKPDIKYRVSVDDIQSLVELQGEILDACSGYVAFGGLLIYSTCTITKDENQRQVERFLSRHPEYALDHGDQYLPEPLRARMEGGMLQLQAHRDHMEGFFIARLRRRGTL